MVYDQYVKESRLFRKPRVSEERLNAVPKHRTLRDLPIPEEDKLYTFVVYNTPNGNKVALLSTFRAPEGWMFCKMVEATCKEEALA